MARRMVRGGGSVNECLVALRPHGLDHAEHRQRVDEPRRPGGGRGALVQRHALARPDGAVLRVHRAADHGDGLSHQGAGRVRVAGRDDHAGALVADGQRMVDPARDRWITTTLRGRLLGDTEVFDINYAITTSRGMVHIIGIAQSQDEIDRVVGHASDIAYVRRIVRHIVLKNDPSRLQAADG